MYRFWGSLVQPLLDQVQPRAVMEVGSFKGENTELLLRYCHQHGATLHAVDPIPLFDVEAWKAEFGQSFQFHQAKSLDVLATIEPADVVLIDGDHNWYTVYNELKQLAVAARTGQHPYPVVLFHDIGWPYARRDLYYDPTDIPAEFRQPYANKGIWPGRSRLHKYGINGNLCNAVHEGGPRNGVLTAVEDFMAEADEPMRLILIDGYHGLGILYPESIASRNPAAANHLDHLAIGVSVLNDHIRSLDERHLSALIHRIRQELREADARTEEDAEAMAASESVELR